MRTVTMFKEKCSSISLKKVKMFNNGEFVAHYVYARNLGALLNRNFQRDTRLCAFGNGH